jgi:hypothetical protein
MRSQRAQTGRAHAGRTARTARAQRPRAARCHRRLVCTHVTVQRCSPQARVGRCARVSFRTACSTLRPASADTSIRGVKASLRVPCAPWSIGIASPRGTCLSVWSLTAQRAIPRLTPLCSATESASTLAMYTVYPDGHVRFCCSVSSAASEMPRPPASNVHEKEHEGHSAVVSLTFVSLHSGQRNDPRLVPNDSRRTEPSNNSAMGTPGKPGSPSTNSHHGRLSTAFGSKAASEGPACRRKFGWGHAHVDWAPDAWMLVDRQE